jgi:8-oxo-dGTP pyrophosphatase MutT (NUDIX family)
MTLPSHYIDKLALIYLKDKKVLCALNKGKEVWYFPGGKRDAGETDEQALVREIQEELSVAVDPKTMKLYGVFEAEAHDKTAGTMLRMTCYTAEVTGELKADNEIERFGFFGYHDEVSKTVTGTMVFDDLYAKKLIQ